MLRRKRDVSNGSKSATSRHWPTVLQGRTHALFVVANATFGLLYALITIEDGSFTSRSPRVQRKLGSLVKSPKPFPGTPSRAICCETGIHRMAKVSVIVFE